jgi:hypothetical protein
MIKVFIGGSRFINRLNNMVRERLNNIIVNKYQVLIGDANGADKAVQEYLHEMNYHDVLIFCSGDYCRNNLGNWEVAKIDVSPNLHGSKFYMVKDARMAEIADYGFMLWDGKSSGTINNVFNLLFSKKKVLLYYSPEKRFYTISKLDDIEQLLIKCEPKEIDRIEKKINLSKLKENLLNPEQIGLELYINTNAQPNELELHM